MHASRAARAEGVRFLDPSYMPVRRRRGIRDRAAKTRQDQRLVAWPSRLAKYEAAMLMRSSRRCAQLQSLSESVTCPSAMRPRGRRGGGLRSWRTNCEDDWQLSTRRGPQYERSHNPTARETPEGDEARNV